MPCSLSTATDACHKSSVYLTCSSRATELGAMNADNISGMAHSFQAALHPHDSNVCRIRDINRSTISSWSCTAISSSMPAFVHNLPEKSDTVTPSTACMPILASSVAFPTTFDHNCLNKCVPKPVAL